MPGKAWLAFPRKTRSLYGSHQRKKREEISSRSRNFPIHFFPLADKFLQQILLFFLSFSAKCLFRISSRFLQNLLASRTAVCHIIILQASIKQIEILYGHKKISINFSHAYRQVMLS